jgi:hypothetical protein
MILRLLVVLVAAMAVAACRPVSMNPPTATSTTPASTVTSTPPPTTGYLYEGPIFHSNPRAAGAGVAYIDLDADLLYQAVNSQTEEGTLMASSCALDVNQNGTLFVDLPGGALIGAALTIPYSFEGDDLILTMDVGGQLQGWTFTRAPVTAYNAAVAAMDPSS